MGMNERVINVAQVEQLVKAPSGDRIKIKLRRGNIEVEIESPIDRVAEVVAKVAEGLVAAGGANTVNRVRRRGPGTVTCRGLIGDLWEEEWFSQPRSLSEVVEELSRRGYNYNSTAVSHSLADLVRGGLLTRVGTPRTYRYVQKRPP